MPSSSATSCAYRASCPSGSVVRLSTILPVGCTRRKTARYASLAIAGSPLGLETLTLLVGGQRVVLFLIAEGGLWAAERVRRRSGPLAARIDAFLLTHRSPSPASSCPCSARGRSASRPSSPGRALRSPRARAPPAAAARRGPASPRRSRRQPRRAP